VEALSAPDFCVMFQKNKAMRKKYKYCDDDDYKDDAYRALSSQFENYQNFETFYSSLNDLEIKNEFLRVGSTYLFFVKNGDWHVNVPRSDSVIEYFTNSFKLVAMLAIIESLSNKKNVDFFEWLSKKDKRVLFPITDRPQLQKLYDEYKSEYGSIRRCKSFLANLSTPTKDKLRNSITINGKPVKTIEKVAEMIYKARSDFAHESNSTLEIGDWFHFSKEKNKEIVWKQLSMQLLQNSFEEGVVIHFKNITTA
jgi:hypothetical protein